MHAHDAAAMQAQQAAQDDYSRQALAVQPGPSSAEEIERLAALRDDGALTEAEFEALKAKALA